MSTRTCVPSTSVSEVTDCPAQSVAGKRERLVRDG